MPTWSRYKRPSLLGGSIQGLEPGGQPHIEWRWLGRTRAAELADKPDPWHPDATSEPAAEVKKGKSKAKAEPVPEPEPAAEPVKTKAKGKKKEAPAPEPEPESKPHDDDGLGESEPIKGKKAKAKAAKPKPLPVESRRRKYETPKEFKGAVKICPKCKIEKDVTEGFGFRTLGTKIAPQPWCRMCRSGKAPVGTPVAATEAPKAKGKKAKEAPAPEPVVAPEPKKKGKAKAEVKPEVKAEPVAAPAPAPEPVKAKAPKAKPLGYTPEQLNGATAIWKRKNVVTTAILKKHLECDEATARLLIATLNKGRTGGDTDTTAAFQTATSEI